MIEAKQGDGPQVREGLYRKRKASKVLTGVLGMISIIILSACGGAATSTALPAPTSTPTIAALIVQPVPTQPEAVSDNSVIATATPELSVSDIATPEMSMDDTSTPDMSMENTPTAVSVADTPVPDTAMPGTPTPVVAEATPTTAQATPTQEEIVSTPTTAATETDVQASLIEWSIQLSQSEVPAGKVVFTVTNEGTMMHNLTIESDSGIIAKTPNFSPSQGAQTLTVDLTPGTYTLICSLPGHAQRGQMATLVVLSQ